MKVIKVTPEAHTSVKLLAVKHGVKTPEAASLLIRYAAFLVESGKVSLDQLQDATP